MWTCNQLKSRHYYINLLSTYLWPFMVYSLSIFCTILSNYQLKLLCLICHHISCPYFAQKHISHSHRSRFTYDIHDAQRFIYIHIWHSCCTKVQIHSHTTIMFCHFPIKENKTPITTPATNVATTPKSTTTYQFLFSGSFFIEPCCIFKFMPQIG